MKNRWIIESTFGSGGEKFRQLWEEAMRRIEMETGMKGSNEKEMHQRRVQAIIQNSAARISLVITMGDDEVTINSVFGNFLEAAELLENQATMLRSRGARQPKTQGHTKIGEVDPREMGRDVKPWPDNPQGHRALASGTDKELAGS